MTLKKYFYILALLLLASCGKIDKPDDFSDNPDNPSNPVKDPSQARPRVDIIPMEPILKTDPTFTSYINYYISMARYHNTEVKLDNVPIVFGRTDHMGSRTLAYCVYLRNGQNAVVVNKDKWSLASELKRILIITHELGHCERGYAHTFEYVPEENLRPKSIMWGWAIKQDIFKVYFWSYFNNFFLEPDSHPKLKINRNYSNDGEAVKCTIEE